MIQFLEIQEKRRIFVNESSMACKRIITEKFIHRVIWTVEK